MTAASPARPHRIGLRTLCSVRGTAARVARPIGRRNITAARKRYNSNPGPRQRSTTNVSDTTDQEYRVDHGGHAVEPVDAAFAPGRRLDVRPVAAEETVTHPAKRAKTEIGDAQAVGEQIVPVQLDERVEIKQYIEQADHGYEPEELVGQRIHRGHAPAQDTHGTQQYLKVGPGKRDEQLLPLFTEEPRIGKVAVETRLKIEQQKAHLVDVTAQVAADQSVRDLVQRDDQEDRHDQKRDGASLQHPRQAKTKGITALRDDDQGPSDDQKRCRPEPRPEQQAQASRPSPEPDIWIDGLDLDEQEASDTAVVRLAGREGGRGLF